LSQSLADFVSDVFGLADEDCTEVLQIFDDAGYAGEESLKAVKHLFCAADPRLKIKDELPGLKNGWIARMCVAIEDAMKKKV
jgi:hypothetical protein